MLCLPVAANAQEGPEQQLYAFVTSAYGARLAEVRKGIFEAELLNACGSEEAARLADIILPLELLARKSILDDVADLELKGLEDDTRRRSLATLYLDGFAYVDATQRQAVLTAIGTPPPAVLCTATEAVMPKLEE